MDEFRKLEEAPPPLGIPGRHFSCSFYPLMFETYALLKLSRWGLRGLLFGLASVSLLGCLASPANEIGKNSDTIGENGDNNVSARPAMLCGEGRAVTAVAEDGTVHCTSPTLKGMAAQTDEKGIPSCPADQTVEWYQVPADSGPGMVAIPTCSEAANQNLDGATLGAPPTEKFSCPQGSALKGFSEKGEPICWSLVGEGLTEAGLFIDQGECPWGMMSGHFKHREFTVPTCISDGKAPRSIKLMDIRVTRVANQAGRLCKEDRVVVGFDEDHRPICGPGPLSLKKLPRRYWATKFKDHSERPVCKDSYQPAPVYLLSSASASLVKVWTCSQD